MQQRLMGCRRVVNMLTDLQFESTGVFGLFASNLRDGLKEQTSQTSESRTVISPE